MFREEYRFLCNVVGILSDVSAVYLSSKMQCFEVPLFFELLIYQCFFLERVGVIGTSDLFQYVMARNEGR